MGKQTNISGSHFGGDWTKEKLTIIEDYLQFYVNALSKQKVQLIYIDAFAGSGKTELQSGETIDGSALISLKYNFDKYYFIELDEERSRCLNEEINTRFHEKKDKVKVITGDSNSELKKLFRSLTVYQRGVMFLDPYAMELEWDVLETAKQTNILDIWYLFPLNALTRNLYKKMSMPIATKNKVTQILGTNEWEKELYHQSAQLSIFGDEPLERVNFDRLVDFVRQRLINSFPYVSPQSRMLKNSNNSPMFILFFMMTNKSGKAIGLGSKVVTDIFNKLDKMSNEVGQ
jgi:hypothetical protein